MRRVFTEKQYRCRDCGKLFSGKYAREACPRCVMRAHSKKKALERRMEEEKRQSASRRSSLNEVAKAAHAAQMTYGQYVALMAEERKRNALPPTGKRNHPESEAQK